MRRNGQDYPPKDLLRLVVGDIGKLPGGDRTNRYFRQLGFEIVELEGGQSDEYPGMATPDQVSEAAVETALSVEADLEDAIYAHPGLLESGLKICKEGGVTGRQVDAKAAGRIDLLAVDESGRLVVIELKAGIADRQVCGQIQAYMGWVRAHLAGGRAVRGLIVAHEFTERAKLAATVVPDLELREYRVRFEFAGV